jgi:hypothetical protein
LGGGGGGGGWEQGSRETEEINKIMNDRRGGGIKCRFILEN